MTIHLETECAQIEMVVDDVPAACAWFERTLGAQPIEQDLVQRMTGYALDIDHRDCGDAVFQFCSPIGDAATTHVQFLAALGPCVTNLNFFVEDGDHTCDVLEAAGAVAKVKLPIGEGIRAALGPAAARPAEEVSTSYFVGSRPLFGFDLEFMTRPWRDGVTQDVFYPAFTYPRPTTNTMVERLAALRVVTPDIDAAIENLVTLIDADSRSEPYGEATGHDEREVRIRLRDLELRYTQPLTPASPYFDRVRTHQGVASAIFRTSDAGAILDRVVGAGVEQDDRRCRIASRSIVGFDVELEMT